MIEDVIRAIKSSESFAIATHLNPDGDALGSATGLHLALKGMGKTSTMFNRDGVPETYAFLPGAGETLTSMEGIKADTLFILDCNNPERAGIDEKYLANFGHSVVIDHHQTESSFGDVRWVDPSIPATGIMIFRILRALGAEVTENIALNLMTAIALDTGTFRYSNTTSEALRVGAELTEAGAKPSHISDNLYNNWSMRRFELFQMAMASLEIMDGGICFMKVSTEMNEQTGTTQPDTENFVNFPLMMQELKVSVLLKQAGPALWRGSIRSKGEVDVSDVAEKFEGGGHINAAGCKFEGTYEDFKSALFSELSKIV